MSPAAPSDHSPPPAVEPERSTGGAGTSALRRAMAAANTTGMLRPTIVMIVLTTAGSAVNYASNLVFSRVLSPENFGDLTALLSFAVIAAVPTGAAQTVVAERVAVHLAAGDTERVRYLIRHACAHVAVIAIVCGLVYTACIPLVRSGLSLQTISPALMLAPLLVVSFFMPLVYGILQGAERFVALGGLLLFIAASRLVFGLPWALAAGGAGGPIFGQTIGNAVALVIAAYLMRGLLLRRGTGAAISGLRRRPDRRTLGASAAFIAFAVLSNLDVVLAKVFLSSRESGLYAALLTLEKIIIFLPSAVAIVMVPQAARALKSEGSAARVLRVAGIIVLVSTLVAVIPAAIAPDAVVRLMFGSAYHGAGSGVLPIILAGAGFALLYLLVVYTVTIQDRRWVWILAGAVVLQIGGIAAFHHSPAQIATVQAVVVGIALMANEIAFHPIIRTRRLILRAAGPRAR